MLLRRLMVAIRRPVQLSRLSATSIRATLPIQSLRAGIRSATFATAKNAPAATPATASRIRKSFVMSVHPGMEVEYERRHNPIWRELEDVLRGTGGAHNYSIWLLPGTRQLFGYVEIDDEARWSALSSHPVVQRWWKHMSDVMPSNPDHSPVASELKPVFYMP